MSPLLNKHRLQCALMNALRVALFLAPISPVLATTCPTNTTSGPYVQYSTTQYQYDDEGNLTQITDPSCNVTTLTPDALNRITNVLQPAATSGGTQPITTTAYDGRDQVTGVTDPLSLVTGYTVDGLGNVTQVASPDTGTTNNAYDAAGNLHTRTIARTYSGSHITATYTYDALNRVTEISDTFGDTIYYTYDGGSPPPSPNYSVGHLTEMVDNYSTTTWTYNSHERVASKSFQLKSDYCLSTCFTYTVQYGYDSDGRLNQITYPSGPEGTANVVCYSFDGQGRINSIGLTTTANGGCASTSPSPTTLISNVQYSPFGGVLGWEWGNGKYYVRTQDVDGHITSYTLSGDTLSGSTYSGGDTPALSYDYSSRLTSVTDSTNSANAFTLAYDNLNRLTGSTPGLTTNNTYTYGYDVDGNRTSMSVGTSGASTSYTYAYPNSSPYSGNQLSTTTSSGSVIRDFLYDATGNIIQDGPNSYAYTDGSVSNYYDGLGRLVTRAQNCSYCDSTGSAGYLPNGLNQRVVEISDPDGTGATYTDVAYFYDEAGHIIGEYDYLYGNILNQTVYLGDIPVVSLSYQPTIVDNTDPNNVDTYGSWTPNTAGTDYWGANYFSAAGSSSATTYITWYARALNIGYFNVYARWPAATDRGSGLTNATNATYTGTGLGSGVTVNQNNNTGQWNQIGSTAYNGELNGVGWVSLNNQANGTVEADAVEFVPVNTSDVSMAVPYYIYTDQLNTPRVMTDSSNNVMWTWSMADPFGNQLPTGTSVDGVAWHPFASDLRFPGQTYDPVSAMDWPYMLHYNNHRDYDPSIGRYIESDPIGLAGGLNTYRYAYDNPLNFIDPQGTCAWCLAFIAGAGADIAIQVVSSVHNGQDLEAAVLDVNLTQAAISGAATATGAGAISTLKDFIAASDLFSTPFEELASVEREQLGDLFARAQATGALSLASKSIGNAFPWKPFQKTDICK